MKCDDVFIFAGAPYSNSAPLVDQLTSVDPRVQVIYDHPAHLVADLQAGRCDAALVPVAHFLAHEALRMIPRLGVAADGDVQSVLLKCNKPLEQVRRVGRDPASASSNALAECVLTRHFGLSVEMVCFESDQAVDAAVVIGDRALLAAPAPHGDIDLAGAWKAMTGLPFVFAVWAVRADHPQFEVMSRIAHKAYQQGAQQLDAISERYACELGQSVGYWKAYLSGSIIYELTDEMLKGLERFAQFLRVRNDGPLRS